MPVQDAGVSKWRRQLLRFCMYQQRVCTVLNRYAKDNLVIIASHVTPTALVVKQKVQLDEANLHTVNGKHRATL